MKTSSLLPFLLGPLVSCTTTSGPSRQVSMNRTEANFAVGVFREYQSYRTGSGKKPLELNLALTNLAQEIAETRSQPGAAERFILATAGQTSARVVEARRNLNLEYISESFYRGNDNAAGVIDVLAATPSAQDTLNGNWNKFGAGVATAPSGETVVVIVTALKTVRRNANMPVPF